jgi:hypothetical protein
MLYIVVRREGITPITKTRTMKTAYINNPKFSDKINEIMKGVHDRTVEFNPTDWLKENRGWIIDQILDNHSKSILVEVMAAVKDVVDYCDNEDEAFKLVDRKISLFNYDAGAAVEANVRELEARKLTHL